MCYQDQFSAAFDTYLMVLAEVKQMVNIAIGTDTPNYCLHHSCPAYNYKLQYEPKLYPTHLIAMDSNNLAKRLLSAGRADDRDFDSDYFLTREEVDHFKDEVKNVGRLQMKF